MYAKGLPGASFRHQERFTHVSVQPGHPFSKVAVECSFLAIDTLYKADDEGLPGTLRNIFPAGVNGWEIQAYGQEATMPV